jgi:hypothetical protein
MKQKLLVFLTFAIFTIAPFSSVYAAGVYKTFSALGVGDVTVAGAGCGDITCPSSGACFCADGTFPFKATGVGGIGVGNIHVELLMDNNTQSHVVAGICENASGKAFFISAKGGNQLAFGLAGRFCQTDPANTSAATVIGSFNISPGSGTFSNAEGTGSFTFGGPGLDHINTSTMQLQMTGNFNKTAINSSVAADAPGGDSDLPTNTR